jgi:catechol 2,3-dioxygenase-like lactoylglutathione lyase family enzyme
MFSHIMVGANNVQESKTFYDAILCAMGHKPEVIDAKGRCFYFTKSGVFALSKPINGEPASYGNGSTMGFSARTTAIADDWHAAGIANGGITARIISVYNLYAIEK